MKNNGDYFQLTPSGKYYPEKISKWKWEGIEFFISPAIEAYKPNTPINEIKQSNWHMVVTHKGTGRRLPDVNSETVTEAKICAEVSLNKIGYDGFLSLLERIE